MAFPIALILGLAAQGIATREADEKKKKLLDAMEAYNVGKAKKSEAAIGEMIASQRPEARTADLDQSIAERAASLGSAVENVRATNPAPIAGKLSQDYEKSQESTARSIDERTRRAIEQLSVIGAPGERAFNNALKFGKTAGDVDSANAAIRNVGGAYMTSIGNTVPNPYMLAAGSALTAYGAGSLGGGTDVGTGIDSGNVEDASGNLYNGGAISQFGRGTQRPVARSGIWGARR